MAREITTIEELSQLTHSELLRLDHKMDTGFREVIDTLKLMRDAFDLVRSDVHDIKITLGPLVRQMAATEQRVAELEKRVARVEEKVGLAL